MKRVLVLILVLCMSLSLVACGGAAAGNETGNETGNAGGAAATGFRVGFGRADVTPKGAVPMASYGNAKDRISEGIYSYLYLNVIAIDDGTTTMLLMTIDHSWFSDVLVNPLKADITNKFGIPAENILAQGTHTHAGPEVGLADVADMAASNKRTLEQGIKAVEQALEDLKPAEAFVGSVMTENLNHVRRYIMDDGSLTGDNYPGTGTKRVAHETEADREVQLLKFVREGGEDVVVVNFQAHPHLEGKSLNLCAQTPGAIREAVEKKYGAKCVYWQGAAGNLNTHSSLEGETPTKNKKEYAQLMLGYIDQVYNDMTPVATGPIKIIHKAVTCTVNHTQDHLLDIAHQVNDIWTSTNNASKAMEVGKPYGIVSVYHAGAIIKKAKLAATQDLEIAAFSFGDVSAVVVPYEMFDTSGMQIKDGTPFAKTFIFGYANPGSYSYMPDEKAFDNVGYEGNSCRFVRGTAEQLVGEYIGMLEEMKK